LRWLLSLIGDQYGILVKENTVYRVVFDGSINVSLRERMDIIAKGRASDKYGYVCHKPSPFTFAAGV
jgi:hypothetical protein